MIKLYWRDEAKTILVRELDNAWTWDEYHHNIAEAHRLINEAGHPVIMLVDARKVQSSGVPKEALLNVSKSNLNLPNNLVAQIVVSESRWVEAITRIFKHVVPQETKKIIFARTMEKAERHIAKFSRKKRRRIKIQI